MITNVYYNSPELKTLGDFLRNESVSPAFGYVNRPKRFLDFLDALGQSNFDKIINSYFGNETLIQSAKRRYNSGNFNAIELRPPITFSIDSGSAKSDLYSTQGNLVQSTDNVQLFMSRSLELITLNRTSIFNNRIKSKGDLKHMHPRITVLLS